MSCCNKGNPKTTAAEEQQQHVLETAAPEEHISPHRRSKVSAGSVQIIVLVLLIVLAGIQTTELFGIERASASLKSSTPSISTAAAASVAPSSALPKQVGGC